MTIVQFTNKTEFVVQMRAVTFSTHWYDTSTFDDEYEGIDHIEYLCKELPHREFRLIERHTKSTVTEKLLRSKINPPTT